ncbi:hypothetical protein [Sphaerothrix gracilis]|uniref:hypothetical protein n=1 Tax=Sphaerothrix gracilis TaxID=3151835 RepID=UPI0031FE14E7
MPNFNSALPSVPAPFWELQRTFARLVVGLSLTLTGLTALPYTSTTLASPQLSEGIGQTLADGVYLFGRSPQPAQIGTEYVVFEVRNQQTVGAFYSPASSFDCFQGEVRPDRLMLTVIGSYEQTASAYAIALQPATALNAAQQGAGAPTTLTGYHAIAELSQTDSHILATCQQAMSPQQAI